MTKLSERLTAGGLLPDTPAAIVYKASWPDQKVVRTTVAGLATAAESTASEKTALILVGDFLGTDYGRSCLYDPSFSHEFREAAP